MKKLLYINKQDPVKRRKVQTAAILQRIRLEQPAEEELDELPADAEFMRMSGFTGGEVQQFLRQLQANGVRVDLCCVETAANRDWPLRKLYDELREEHAQLHRK